MTRNIILSLEKSIETNKVELDKLESIDTYLTDVNFCKNRQEIILLEDYLFEKTDDFLFTSYYESVSISFENLSDIDILSIIPYVVYHTNPGFQIENDNDYFKRFEFEFRAYWKEIETTQTLFITLKGFKGDYEKFKDIFVSIPIYVNLKLIIQNAHVWDSIQKMRT